VTLNITVLSRTAIHQSADFRLSRAGKALAEPSTKRLVVTYADWSGFITYAGVGRKGSQDTSDVVRAWLRGIADISFEELAKLLGSKGSMWLSNLALQPHTFVLAGFDRGVPKASLISNFERWHGQQRPVTSRDLEISTVEARNRPEVLVTGYRPAVLRQERRGLHRLVEDHGHEETRIRVAMMAINRAAAARQPELISPECIVYSQGVDGHGAEMPSGDIAVRNTGLLQGQDLDELIRPFLEETFGKSGWRVVQSASARSGPRLAPPPCEIDIVGDPDSAYGLQVLPEATGRRATPHAADGRTVAGEGSPEFGGPSFPCVWQNNGDLQVLPHLGGFGGRAVSISHDGIIVGQSELPDRSMHANMWQGGTLIDVHPTGNRSSGVRGVSPSGRICGWVAEHPTEHGQLAYRPTIWEIGGGVTILSDMKGGWGEAVSVTDEGLVTGFVYHGHDSSAWILEGNEVTFIGRPPEPCRSYIPYALGMDGRVVGVQIDRDESRHIATWLDGRWEMERMPSHTVAEAFSRDGRSAGRLLDGDLALPWIREQGVVRRLPHLRHHNHTVTAIFPKLLLGAGLTQQCAHPLVWTRA
jgi:hypothetical protein